MVKVYVNNFSFKKIRRHKTEQKELSLAMYLDEVSTISSLHRSQYTFGKHGYWIFTIGSPSFTSIFFIVIIFTIYVYYQVFDMFIHQGLN